MILLQAVHDTVLVFDLDHVRQLRHLGIVGVLVGTLPRAPQQNVFLGLPLQLTIYEAWWLVAKGHAALVDSVKYNNYVGSGLTLEAVNVRCRVQILLTSQLLYAVTPDYHRLAEEQQQPGGDESGDPSETEMAGCETGTAKILDSSHALAQCQLSLLEFVGRQSLPDEFEAKLAAFAYLRNLDYYMMPGLRFGGVFVAYPGDPLQYHSHLIVKVLGRDQEINLLELVTSGRLATAVKKAWILMDQHPAKAARDDGSNLNAESVRAYSIEWAGFG